MALVYNEQTGNFDDIPIPPIIRSFVLEESEPFYQGDSVTFNWQIDDTNHVYFNDEELEDSQITVKLNEIGQQSFILKTTNSDGISERTISIEVLQCPEFNINTSSTVLREGLNESVLFHWEIKNAQSLQLHHDDSIENLPLEGELSFKPTSDTKFDFEAEGTSGNRKFHHIIPIIIRKASQIKFKASRLFSYPNLPIRLSWDVENAESVYIDGIGERPTNGSLTVTPGMDTTYILRVKDAFGEEQRALTVRMLPLPVITQLFVPNPKLEENLAISYKTPQFEAIVPVPTFESSLVKLSAPQIPSLRLSSHFVYPIAKKEKRRFRNPFKTLFSYFFRK